MGEPHFQPQECTTTLYHSKEVKIRHKSDKNSLVKYEKATESVAFSKQFLAEGVGIEPTHGFDPVYGLAIRCITILPALRRSFLSNER